MRHAHLDYPTSETYEGPLDNTGRAYDIEGQPLTHHVTVYHSGRSDEQTTVKVEKSEKPEEPEFDIADAVKNVGDKVKGFGQKITGLFKKSHAHFSERMG